MGSSVEPGITKHPVDAKAAKQANHCLTHGHLPRQRLGSVIFHLGFFRTRTYCFPYSLFIFIYLYQFCFLFCFDFVAYYKAGYSKYTQWLDGFSDPSSFAYINYAARRSQSDVHHTAPWWYQVPCAQSPVPH